MNRELSLVVATEDDGRELKRVLRSRLGVSHKQLTSAKAREGLLLDGVPVHADARVRAGQTLSFRFEDDETREGARWDERPVNIAYEDDDLLVVNKSAPLACQCGLDHEDDALENRLAYYFRDRAYVLRPVNRLDKGTSGLMLVAKHPHAQTRLQALLHTDEFVREYLAVLDGLPADQQGVVDAPIGKADGATIRREVRADGKLCRTRYRVLCERDGLSLVRLRLETGRTHQIRVHMAHIGCPVLGDFLYGREDERLPGRFALHSAHVRFAHPISGTAMAFDAPLSEDIAEIIGKW